VRDEQNILHKSKPQKYCDPEGGVSIYKLLLHFAYDQTVMWLWLFWAIYSLVHMQPCMQTYNTQTTNHMTLGCHAEQVAWQALSSLSSQSCLLVLIDLLVASVLHRHWSACSRSQRTCAPCSLVSTVRLLITHWIKQIESDRISLAGKNRLSESQVISFELTLLFSHWTCVVLTYYLHLHLQLVVTVTLVLHLP